MPSATSRAIEPVGITSTGARSSLPSRMTEPFPNCRSIWARADSRAFSRSTGEGMACSLCSRSVACRLSRSAPSGTDAATRRVVSFDVVHARGGLRHPSSLLPSLWTDTLLDTCCAGAYAGVEQIFDDTPRRRRDPRRQRRRGLEAPDAVAALGRDVGLGAQREPDLAGRDAGASACAAVRSPSSDSTRSAISATAARAELVARRRDRTHCGACWRSEPSSDGLSAARARRRPRRPGRRARRRGRSAGPRAPRCGRRPRA